MGVNLKRKRGSLTSHDPPAMEVVMVMVALVLLINTNSCGASFVLKSNVSSYRQCIGSGAMDGCLIADDLDLEFDFFMDTHIVRFLDESEQKQSAGGGGGGASGTPHPERKACYSETGQQYTCDPKQKHLQKCVKRGIYYRLENCYEE